MGPKGGQSLPLKRPGLVSPALPAEKFADTMAMLKRTFGGMTPEVRVNWGNAQANIAIGYLLLLAKEFGLDTSPRLGFAQDQVKTLLSIPASATITALVALGHGAEEGFVSHRHDVKRIASFRRPRRRPPGFSPNDLCAPPALSTRPRPLPGRFRSVAPLRTALPAAAYRRARD